jgi:3',5'-cyclic AMP phosphodiesterase CpdA
MQRQENKGMRYTLMHLSDLHAGPPFDAEIAAKVIHEAQEIRPDLIVVSGDFVQRADINRQWQTIKRFLAELPQPHLYVAGNHDVPLFNPFKRLFNPLETYQREITTDLNPVFEKPGLAVVGACSAHGRTIDGGLVKPDQILALQQAFARQPAGTCRVAVLHHHVISPPGIKGRRQIKNTDQVVEVLEKSKVDLFLCGHIHVSYVGTTLDVRQDIQRGTIICQCGTTTSRRGKGRERGKNSYNVIEIDEQAIRINQRLFVGRVGKFESVSEHTFPR